MTPGAFGGVYRMCFTIGWLAIGFALIAGLLGGCAQYTTPGGPADFRALGITPDQQAALTDEVIAGQLARRPAASFPAAIAVARVQGRGYRSYGSMGYGSGEYTLAMTREVETDDDFQRLRGLAQVRGVAPLNRLVVSDAIEELSDLRSAAASVQADVLLLYTFDTRFGVDTVVPAMGVITLGLFPGEEARVTTTCSAALIDTRTGYVYGLAESTAKADQLANTWTSREAIDQSRLRAEREAFAGTIAEIESVWNQIAAALAEGHSAG